ncbi:MAG: hypothetical protein RL015_293 [Verrucomicrobiota bacterium]|jgi:hypothetical protein
MALRHVFQGLLESLPASRDASPEVVDCWLAGIQMGREKKEGFFS